MSIALINSMCAGECPPPIPPLALARVHGLITDQDVRIHDLDLILHQALGGSRPDHDFLTFIFGGNTFSYPRTAFIPSNEFPFESLAAVGLLLALCYQPANIAQELRDREWTEGVSQDRMLALVLKAQHLLESAADELCEAKILVIHMPEPGSVLPGLVLAHYVAQRNPSVRRIGWGRQANVPVVAELAKAMGALHAVAGVGAPGLVDLIFQNMQKSRGVATSAELDLSCLPIEDYPIFRGLRVLPYWSARGCAFRCNFCSERLDWDADGKVLDGYFPVPLREVERDIDRLVEAHHPARLTLGDCTVNIGSKRSKELLSMLSRKPLLYGGCLRVDHLDSSTIEALHLARFTHAIVGLETASPRSARIFQKGTKQYVNRARSAIPELYAAGIIPQLNILICHPYETLDEIEQSVQALTTLVEYLDAQGVPFSGSALGTIYLNYPSKMYFKVMNDPAFRIVYHQISSPLRRAVPPQVAQCVSKVPMKAIRQGTPASHIVNKLDFSRRVKALTCTDRERVLQGRVRALGQHAELIAAAWKLRDVRLRLRRGGGPSIGKAESKEEQPPNRAGADSSVSVRTLVERTEPGDLESMVSTLLTLSMSGMADLKPGDTSCKSH